MSIVADWTTRVTIGDLEAVARMLQSWSRYEIVFTRCGGAFFTRRCGKCNGIHRLEVN